jgi:hypothetical protein
MGPTASLHFIGRLRQDYARSRQWPVLKGFIYDLMRPNAGVWASFETVGTRMFAPGGAAADPAHDAAATYAYTTLAPLISVPHAQQTAVADAPTVRIFTGTGFMTEMTFISVGTRVPNWGVRRAAR